MGIKKKRKKKWRSCGRPGGGILPMESKGVSEPITMCCSHPPFPSSPGLSRTVTSRNGWGGGRWSGRSTKGVKMNKRRGNQSNQGALIPPCTSASLPPPTPPPPPDYLHFSHAIAVAPFAPSRQYINILCVIDREPQKNPPTAALLMKH